MQSSTFVANSQKNPGINASVTTVEKTQKQKHNRLFVYEQETQQDCFQLKVNKQSHTLTTEHEQHKTKLVEIIKLGVKTYTVNMYWITEAWYW